MPNLDISSKQLLYFYAFVGLAPLCLFANRIKLIEGNSEHAQIVLHILAIVDRKETRIVAHIAILEFVAFLLATQ